MQNNLIKWEDSRRSKFSQNRENSFSLEPGEIRTAVNFTIHRQRIHYNRNLCICKACALEKEAQNTVHSKK